MTPIPDFKYLDGLMLINNTDAKYKLIVLFFMSYANHVSQKNKLPSLIYSDLNGRTTQQSKYL